LSKMSIISHYYHYQAEFFRTHGSATTDAQQKYNSRAAQLYKEKLQQMAIQSMKVHGGKVSKFLFSSLNCGD
jgi:hypothetical protein